MKTGWLFTRGSQSVRLIREDDATGCVRLIVYGPGTEVTTYDFPNVTECMKRQAEIEQHVLASGYQLLQRSSDRRAARGIWHGIDRRKAS